MIEIRQLGKSFGSQHLFVSIDLTVAKGEAVALIGPSGSGKSTLLRCINGLETFDSGAIVVDGATLQPGDGAAQREAVRRIRRQVGMVFQQFNLFPHLTVLENIIEAPQRVLGVAHREAVDQARQLLARVHLAGKIDRYPEQLSGGEQQRVAIARALAMRPQAMLFDEPTSALDPERVGEVLRVIAELVDEGMTTMIATHEMDFAAEVADRVAVLDAGGIVEVGPPDLIFRNPTQDRTRAFLKRVLRRHAGDAALLATQPSGPAVEVPVAPPNGVQ
jgi:ABC-type polar amino acid transport system ATPase subunit